MFEEPNRFINRSLYGGIMIYNPIIALSSSTRQMVLINEVVSLKKFLLDENNEDLKLFDDILKMKSYNSFLWF